jgi:sorting nexin-9/18/33
MTTQVHALYDFAGEPGSSELTIKTGDILTVTNWDVGEGWWEGTNGQGQRGLFPAAYVEKIEPTAPPVVPPQDYRYSNSQTTEATAPPRYDATYDDDWDNSSDEDGNYDHIPAANNQSRQSVQPARATNLPHSQSDDTVSLAQSQTTMRKSTKMFSKTGDSYIMGTSSVAVPEGERVFIVQIETGYAWKTLPDSYTVRVASPKKETKLKGLKSFIAYQLTPSWNGIAVSRRYKHFDWLHERLVEKFSLIPVPPLPDKQISGRYEEQFIEHRRVQLQEFVDWVCRHPVLSKCEVWMHFLTCTDEKRWKVGKRTAEKDVLCGVTYCAAIFPPEKQLLQSQVDSQIDVCHNFVQSMSGAVKALIQISDDQTKKFQLQWKKDYHRVGDGLSELARALELDERRAVTHICLSNAVGQAAGVFISIGQLFGEQPKFDWVPFADRLHIYRGVLNAFPDVLSEHKNGMQKRKECEKLTAEQRMGNAQLQDVTRRTDIMSYAVMSEMTHFRSERDQHLKETLRNFLDAQIQFYQQVVVKLEMAKQFFD